MSDNNVLDVCSFHYDIADIRRHCHHYLSRIPETPRRQARLLEKWERLRESLHADTRRDPELTDRLQLERCARIVDYAFNTIPFYTEIYRKAGYRTGDIITWQDFEALPTISKSDLIREYPLGIVKPELEIERCYGARTSGSTGLPLTLVRDDAAADRRMLEIFRQFETMLKSPLKREDWIYNIYHSPWIATSLSGHYRTFSISQDCPPESILEHFSLLRPRFVSAFPSFLARLQEVGSDLGQFGIECLSTNSESSSRAERQAFSRTFGVPVLDEYSSEELPSIAIECEHGNYHVEEDRIRFELIDIDSEGVGTTVGTDLFNIYMPIIRYVQGDLARFAPASQQGQCPCGNRYRHLNRLHGRADQVLHSTAIGRVMPDCVLDLVDKTLARTNSHLREFRIVQKSENLVEVISVLESGRVSPNEELVNEFRNGMRRLFGCDLSIPFTIVGEIPQLSSYKRRMVINQLP
jgi:phenylacetate-CoA ligase